MPNKPRAVMTARRFLCRFSIVGVLIAIASQSAVAMGIDFGDAPDSYGLASHVVTANAPFLGNNQPDGDAGLGSVNADADDQSDATDDEDGVFEFPVLVQNTKAYSVNVFVTNLSGQEATLRAWVDFNLNGIFDSFESASVKVADQSDQTKVKLIWPNLHGVSNDSTGQSYARFRISTSEIPETLAAGELPNGEVEDYTVEIQPDADGDEIADSIDTDLDNDSIPNDVEGENLDSDNDGLVNALDPDSDGDGIPDLLEAGEDGSQPVDTDGDGTPDYLDEDSNNDGEPDQVVVNGDVDGDGINGDVEGLVDSDGDGVLNPFDIDSDNDGILDAVETEIDTDADSVPDFLDLDSDNDGLSDLYESGIDTSLVASLDADGNGRIDESYAVGANGLADTIEDSPESGSVTYNYLDTDQDSIRDAIDGDSDNDGASDLIESGGVDVNNDGQLDALIDSDGDAVPDVADVDVIGGEDADNDSIADNADADFVLDVDDSDLDGIIDSFDPDSDADGIVDAVATPDQANLTLPDADQDGTPDFLDDQVVTAPDGPSVVPNDEKPAIKTGLDGYPGCTIATSNLSPDSKVFDPLLLMLLAGSLIWIGVRVRRVTLQA